MSILLYRLGRPCKPVNGKRDQSRLVMDYQPFAANGGEGNGHSPRKDAVAECDLSFMEGT